MNEKGLVKYCYNNISSKEWIEFLNQSPHENYNRLDILKEENVLCIPDCGRVGNGFSGGLFTKGGMPIESSFQREGLKTSFQLLKLLTNEGIKYKDEDVVYLGQYRNQWGSFLVDSISRLWFALKDSKKYKYVFLATQESLGGIHKNAFELLNLLGIKKEQIIYLTEPTQFKSVIIPDMSYIPMGTYKRKCCWHREYLEVIRKVVSAVPDCILEETYEKIYFSRGRFSKKQKSDYGEELIAHMMRKNGFFVVYPEEHTLQEQIAMVNKCKIFASVGGSCAHNIIFSQTKPKIILFNRMNGYQWHQWMLDEMAGVEPITYVDGYCEPYKMFYKTDIRGPFLFWVNSNMKKFAKENGFDMSSVNGLKMQLHKCEILTRYSLRIIHLQLYKFKRGFYNEF